ncbi:MAG: hypothetical protein GY758_11455 [Fuerstiella sp.]|jgi:hypothetical protein|nr:hypothetical protein [Fuerstiella sp.]MCP4510009.1 hypothetical protein [Fuerstiella sp.]MDG2130523.1 hypothetical protein [Fuerstiella sp.]
MVNEDDLRRRRVYVGLLAVASLIGAVVLLFYPGNDGVQGALVRVGLVMGAFWLALPTKTRPAAWKGMMSGWTAPGLIITALVIPRLKFMFPVLAIIVGIAYFARPRTRK